MVDPVRRRNRPMPEVDRDDVLAAIRHAAAAAELATVLGGEITALVQEVHAASSPVALVGAVDPARAVYGGIRLGFTAAAKLATWGGRLAHVEPSPDAWLDVQSALNGAFGHRFAAAESVYALPMTLHPTERAAVPTQRRIV